MSAVVGSRHARTRWSPPQRYTTAISPRSTTSAGSPDLTGISAWVFRVISSDSANGADMAQVRDAHRPPARGDPVRERPYGRGLADAFRKNFHRRDRRHRPDPRGRGRATRSSSRTSSSGSPTSSSSPASAAPRFRCSPKAKRQGLKPTSWAATAWDARRGASRCVRRRVHRRAVRATRSAARSAEVRRGIQGRVQGHRTRRQRRARLRRHEGRRGRARRRRAPDARGSATGWPDSPRRSPASPGRFASCRPAIPPARASR